LFYNDFRSARKGLFKNLKYMSIGTKIVDYFKTSREELKKVAWPTKKETTRYTLIVMGLCIAVAVFFGILDGIFNLGLNKIISFR